MSSFEASFSVLFVLLYLCSVQPSAFGFTHFAPREGSRGVGVSGRDARFRTPFTFQPPSDAPRAANYSVFNGETECDDITVL